MANDRINRLTLELFGGVLSKDSEVTSETGTQVAEAIKLGLVTQPGCEYALDTIVSFYKDQKVSGADANNTFYKDWNTVLTKTREEILIDQIRHYFSTYGMQALGMYSDGFIWLPAGACDIPDDVNLKFRVVKALGEKDIVEVCQAMFTSGIALTQETIEKVISLLDLVGYKFTDVDWIRNKEAKLIVMSQKNLMPSDGAEFMRYLVYKATGGSLLIKSPGVIAAIKASQTNIVDEVNSFGLIEAAKIFNRFKPLFLAFRSNTLNRKVINLVSRLSKEHHAPMWQNYINQVTSATKLDEDKLSKALQNATVFKKVQLLNSLTNRLNGGDASMYRIRNGKVFVARKNKSTASTSRAIEIVLADLAAGLSHLRGAKVFYPENVDYGVPTSEKNYIGNLPFGTTFTSDKDLVVGVHWRNEWGARDLDLSALGLGAKIGWNASFSGNGGSIAYSGDITSAPDGATELLYVKGSLDQPYMALNNIYSGQVGCEFKLFVGKSKGIKRNTMIDQNDILFQAKLTTEAKQTILGIFTPEGKGSKFVLTNANFGKLPVSYGNSNSDIAREYLHDYSLNVLTLKTLLTQVGVEFVTEDDRDTEGVIDLSVENVNRDTLMNLLVKPQAVIA